MNNFIFHIPTTVCFGEDSLKHIGDKVGSLGNRVMVVHGKTSVVKSGLFQRVVDALTQSGCIVFDGGGVPPNPSYTTVKKIVAIAKENNVNCLLAVGGGSVIDTSKAVASCMLTSNYSGFWQQHFEQFVPITQALPLAVVLTIPASGSETSNACVISDEHTGIKRIASGPAIIPAVSLLDPTNTFSLPGYQTACGCSDILSHLHERYFDSSTDNLYTDRLLEASITHILEISPRVLSNPKDYQLRSEVMWLGTLAHSQVLDRGREGGDWACHMIEHALSGFCEIPHGAGLSIITPAWMRYVAPMHKEKFMQYAQRIWNIELLPNEFEKRLEIMINALKNFYRTLGLPVKLKEVGVQREHLKKIAEAATSPSFPIGGMQPLQISDVLEILHIAWE